MTQLKVGRPTRKEKAIEAVQSMEEITRLNINLPKSFYMAIKRKALDQDITVTTLVQNALNEYMSK